MDAPNLSKVSAKMRRQIALAETQGWTWRPYEWYNGDHVALLWDDRMGPPHGDDFMWLSPYRAKFPKVITSWFLPDPERDASLLGDLMVKELSGWYTRRDDFGKVLHWCSWEWTNATNGKPLTVHGREATSLGAAVVFAVLEKNRRTDGLPDLTGLRQPA